MTKIAWTQKFDDLDVPAGGVAEARAVMPFLFRGTRLEVKESLPGSTCIIAIFVRNKFQFPVPVLEGIPSLVFNGGLGCGDLLLDTCERDEHLTFWVRNKATVPVRWSAELHGLAVKG